MNEIQSRAQEQPVHYWRDKRGHEVDFILSRRGQPPIAIECKWSAGGFEAQNLRAFRQRYPEGENWIVAQDVDRVFHRTENGLRLDFYGINGMVRRLGE